MAVVWAIGAGTGLAGLAGFRAFLPLAVFMLMARLGWAWGFTVQDTPFEFLQSSAAILVLLGLVLVEVLLTRVAGLAQAERFLRLPLGILSGALVFSAALSGELGWEYALGIPGGIALALLGFYVYRGITLLGEGRDPGPALDLLVVLLSAVMMLLPPAGFVLAAILVWLALRVRRLKRMKYKGLRVLA
jgi:hypothetical protein